VINACSYLQNEENPASQPFITPAQVCREVPDARMKITYTFGWFHPRYSA
jgi:hypothetical protein